jgi:hypothetical protein
LGGRTRQRHQLSTQQAQTPREHPTSPSTTTTNKRCAHLHVDGRAGGGRRVERVGEALGAGAEDSREHRLEVPAVERGADRLAPHAPLVAARDCKALAEEELGDLF